MTERKFTDEDLIKALGCCTSAECDKCKWEPRGDCYRGSVECNDDLMRSALDLINRQRAEIDKLCAAICEISEAMKDIVIIELDGQPIPRRNTSRHDVYKACDKIQSILWRYKCKYIDFQLAQLRAQREDNPAR